MGRWENKFPPDQLVQFEGLIGDYMRELGYPRSTASQGRSNVSVNRARFIYRLYYDFKQWAKVNTPLSRMMVSYSEILIDK